MADETKNPLELSDEDFMNSTPPESGATSTSEPDGSEIDENNEQNEEIDNNVNDEAQDKTDDDSSKDKDDNNESEEKSDEDDNTEEKSESDGDKKNDDETKANDEKVEEKPIEIKDEKTPKEKSNDENKEKKEFVPPSVESAQEFYKKVMAPFKANGKTIELKTPEEAIQLMQMGANYTRKMQDIREHRRVLLMLENNQLLDESKLSYLIDLNNKNPDAIKKLIKDANIDPLDIDTSVEPAYSEGNHKVNDEQLNFRTILDEVASTDEGTKTVKHIQDKWDQASKDVLWKSPEILQVIHEQRVNGVYDLIANEVDRRITLGSISPNTSFLEAYKLVGDEMAAEALKNTSKDTTKVVEEEKKEPLEVRVAKPKKPVENEDKADAASQTRGTPRKAKIIVNPLSMSDDDFMKSMENRL